MSTTEEIDVWPTLTLAEVRTMLRRLREESGIKPRRITAAEARQQGYSKCLRDLQRHVERLAREATNE